MVLFLQISKEFNPKLVRLAIDFYRNSNIVNHLKLVELDDVMLSFENFISYPKQWCQFAINNPNIRDLKISANNLTDDTLKELIPLKELRYLEIECAEDNQFLSVTFENLFENCKKLVEFKLDDLYYSSSVSPDLDDDSDYPDEFFDSE